MVPFHQMPQTLWIDTVPARPDFTLQLQPSSHHPEPPTLCGQYMLIQHGAQKFTTWFIFSISIMAKNRVWNLKEVGLNLGPASYLHMISYK